MFYLFILAKSDDFCIKASDYTGVCSEGRKVITDITQFYNAFESNPGHSLEVLNTPNSVISIDFSNFKDGTVMILGRDTSKISIINPMDIHHSHVNLQNIVARFDDTRFVPIFMHEFNLNNVTFENAETIELSTEHLTVDAYSIQFFKKMDTDQLNMLPVEQSMIPKRDAYIHIDGFKPSRISHFTTDVEISLSTRQLNLSWGSATYYIELEEKTKMQITHDSDVTVYVTNPINSPVIADKYTFNVKNAKLVADFKRYNEGPTVVTTGESVVVVNKNAIFLTVNSGKTVLKGLKGTSQGSTLTVSNGAILQLAESVNPYQAMSVQISGTGQIIADSNVVLQQNGLFEVKNTVFPAQIGQNVTLRLNNPQQMHFDNAEFTIDTIDMNGYNNLYVNFQAELHEGVIIKNGLENAQIYYRYLPEIMPTNDEADILMKNYYKGICSPTITCDNITATLIDSTVHGFNNDESLVQFVCKKVDENYCSGVVLTGRPLDYYPQYCIYDTDYQCTQPYLDVKEEDIPNMANIIPKTSKLVTFQTQCDMKNYVSFKGIENTNILFTGDNLVNIDFEDTKFGNLTIDTKSVNIKGTGSAESLTTTLNAINFTGKATIDSTKVVLTHYSIENFNGFKSAQVNLQEGAKITFENFGWTIDGKSYHIPAMNAPKLEFQLPFWSTVALYVSAADNLETVHKFPLKKPVGGLGVDFEEGWMNSGVVDLFDGINDTIDAKFYENISPMSLTSFKEYLIGAFNENQTIYFKSQNLFDASIKFVGGNASRVILPGIDMYGNVTIHHTLPPCPVTLENSTAHGKSNLTLIDINLVNFVLKDESFVNSSSNNSSIIIIMNTTHSPFFNGNASDVKVEWSLGDSLKISKTLIAKGKFDKYQIYPDSFLSGIKTIKASLHYECDELYVIFSSSLSIWFLAIIISLSASVFVIIVALIVYRCIKRNNVHATLSLISDPLLTAKPGQM